MGLNSDEWFLIMVIFISGLVPLICLVFPPFISAYIIGLSRFAFPSHSYLAYVLGGFARCNNHDVRMATPHMSRNYILSGGSLFLMVAIHGKMSEDKCHVMANKSLTIYS
ncbi:hypothetical protein GQ457_17G000720 [Hibiscus cannabinus]